MRLLCRCSLDGCSNTIMRWLCSTMFRNHLKMVKMGLVLTRADRCPKTWPPSEWLMPKPWDLSSQCILALIFWHLWKGQESGWFAYACSLCVFLCVSLWSCSFSTSLSSQWGRQQTWCQRCYIPPPLPPLPKQKLLAKKLYTDLPYSSKYPKMAVTLIPQCIDLLLYRHLRSKHWFPRDLELSSISRKESTGFLI